MIKYCLQFASEMKDFDSLSPLNKFFFVGNEFLPYPFYLVNVYILLIYDLYKLAF